MWKMTIRQWLLIVALVCAALAALQWRECWRDVVASQWGIRAVELHPRVR